VKCPRGIVKGELFFSRVEEVARRRLSLLDEHLRLQLAETTQGIWCWQVQNFYTSTKELFENFSSDWISFWLDLFRRGFRSDGPSSIRPRSDRVCHCEWYTTGWRWRRQVLITPQAGPTPTTQLRSFYTTRLRLYIIHWRQFTSYCIHVSSLHPAKCPNHNSLLVVITVLRNSLEYTLYMRNKVSLKSK